MLVIKEDMRTEGSEDVAFLDTAKEEGFVHTNAPVAKGLDGTLVSWYAPGSHQRRPDGRLFLGLIDILQP